MSRWSVPLWYDRLGGIAWRAVIVVVAAVLLVSGIVAMSLVILPIVLGLLFACGLQPVVRWLDGRRVPRTLGSALAILALILAIGVVALLTVRAVVDHWDDITTLLEEGRKTLIDAAADWGVDDATADSVDEDVSGFAASAAGALVTGLVSLVPTVAGIVTTVLLSFVVAFFFLKDGPTMWRWVVLRLGSGSELADRVGARVWSTLSGFIIGQTTIAAVDAGLIGIGAVLLGVPEVGAIFMLTFFGAYIPYIGAFLSGLLAVMLALGEGGLATGTAMILIVVGVQLLEGNVLQPWIQGRAVRLHPLVIALAVTAGGVLAGFLGLLLAVPVAASAFVTLSELRRAGIVGPAFDDVAPARDSPDQ